MSEQQYSDKPLAYLDQNILDLFTEPQCLLKKDSELFNFLKNEVQAVYSPTTLEEIYRSVINGKSSVYGLAFLDVLKELNAHFITLIIENGEVTNTIFRSWEEPLIHFNQFVSVHDKFHRTLILSGFCLLKIAKISLNSSFFPKPIKR